MSYYQVEGRPLAALAHPARKARYGGRLRQGQRRAQLRAARRSAPLAVRCPRRRLNRAATGIKRNRRRSGRRAARCARAPLRRGLPFLRVARPAGRASRGGSPSAALRRFAPRRRCAGRAALRLVARVRRGGRALPARAVRARLRGLRSSPPPRSSRPCGAAPLRRVPPVRRPAVPAAFPGGGAASGRSGRAGGGVRGLRPLLPGCAPARFGPCRAACGLWRPSGGVGFSPISPPPLAPAGGQGERRACGIAAAGREIGRNCARILAALSALPLPAAARAAGPPRPVDNPKIVNRTIRRPARAAFPPIVARRQGLRKRRRSPAALDVAGCCGGKKRLRALDNQRHSCYTNRAVPVVAPSGAAPKGVSMTGTAPSDSSGGAFIFGGLSCRRPARTKPFYSHYPAERNKTDIHFVAFVRAE